MNGKRLSMFTLLSLDTYFRFIELQLLQEDLACRWFYLSHVEAIGSCQTMANPYLLVILIAQMLARARSRITTLECPIQNPFQHDPPKSTCYSQSFTPL